MERSRLASDVLWAIADGLEVIIVSSNEVLVQFGSRSRPSELFRDTELKGLLGSVVALFLERPSTLDAALDHLQEDQRGDGVALIETFIESGMLVEARRSPIDQYLRYAFGETSTLASKAVSVLGAGPIGARVSHALLQHGVGSLTLLDSRTVDPRWYRSLPMDLEATREETGRADVVLRERLHMAGWFDVNSLDAELDVSGIEATVANADFVVAAFEQPDLGLSHLINRICIREQKTWMLVTIDGNNGLVGPIFVPADTACYNCYTTLADAATPSPEIARLYRRQLLRRGRGSFFVALPVYADIVAGHAALAIIHQLLRDSSFAVGRVLTFDFARMHIDVEDVLKLPRCPVCGIEKSAYRPTIPVDLAAPR